MFAFRNDPDRAATPGEEEAWGAWFGELGGAVADFGNRVGRAAMVGAGGASPYRDALFGYVVVNAESLESAVQLVQGCPGLRAVAGITRPFVSKVGTASRSPAVESVITSRAALLAG